MPKNLVQSLMWIFENENVKRGMYRSCTHRYTQYMMYMMYIQHVRLTVNETCTCMFELFEVPVLV